MKMFSFKAPMKKTIAKCALFAAFTFATLSHTPTLEAHAAETLDAVVARQNVSIETQADIEKTTFAIDLGEVDAERESTFISSQTNLDTGAKYFESTFGETLSSDCEKEADIEYVTEQVCKNSNFKYVTPELLEAIAFQEGTFRVNAQNGSATTMYQIIPQYHLEELADAGLTLDDLKGNSYNQTLFAAHVLEKYGEDKCGGDMTNAVEKITTCYHLTARSAQKILESGEYDSYTRMIKDRMERISHNKEMGTSALSLARAQIDNEHSLGLD